MDGIDESLEESPARIGFEVFQKRPSPASSAGQAMASTLHSSESRRSSKPQSLSLQGLEHKRHIYLGFSGGLDSRVLLDLLSQNPIIKKKLTAVHINHGLSENAENWEIFTKKISDETGIVFQSFSVKIESKTNLEEKARNKRYEIFESLLKNEHDVLLLAHHQNDQAETLLLHLFRGAGIDGLSAMPEWRALGAGQLYRPLLNISRMALEAYANEKKLTWIDDESNANVHFDRNFLRQQIIPLLQTRWPAVVSNLSRSANHCSVAREQIREMGIDLLEKIMDDNGNKKLNIALLKQESRDKQMLILRLWLEKLGFKKPDQNKLDRVLDELIPAAQDRNPVVAWKEGEIRRYQGSLYVLFAVNGKSPLTPPVSSTGQALLERGEKLSGSLDIRFRKGGEKIKLSGKTRELKKLFQQWQIPPWERNQIPLIYIDNKLACVQGFAVSDDFLEYFNEKKVNN